MLPNSVVEGTDRTKGIQPTDILARARERGPLRCQLRETRRTANKTTRQKQKRECLDGRRDADTDRRITLIIATTHNLLAAIDEGPNEINRLLVMLAAQKERIQLLNLLRVEFWIQIYRDGKEVNMKLLSND